MSHITTCTTCGKLYEEFSEEYASAPDKRECGACWMKREDANTRRANSLKQRDRFRLAGFDAQQSIKGVKS